MADIAQKQQVAGYARLASGHRPIATHEEIYGDLPVVKEVIPVSGDDKVCNGCGSPMVHLDQKYVREEIRLTPAVITRIQIYQETLICQCNYEYC